jgi:DNA polymerase V
MKEIEIYQVDHTSKISLPMAGESIHAGFPSPAQDYMLDSIDLNKECIRHPATTFYGRVVGDSMEDAGVHEGDILVIDKSLEPSDGKMAVCFIDGEFTLKTIFMKDNAILLVPANPQYPTIRVTEDNDFQIWGIVTYIIKRV